MNMWEKIGNFLGGLLKSRAETPWLDIAMSQLGVKEIPGLSHNDAILEYHKTTTLKATSDEVPWCSSFVNWCFTKAGIPGTNSAAARSWLHWGEETKPKKGAVIVLSRGNNPANGHVGFFLESLPGGKILVLGGNQGNQVSKQTFPASHVLGCRWPKGDA